MTNNKPEIKFSYKGLFSALFSFLILYWLYQLINGLSNLENRIMELPYSIRFVIENLFPSDTDSLVKAYSKLNMFAYFFLVSFLIKGIISIKQALTSNLINSQRYVLVLFILEFIFLYFNFNLKLGETFVFLLVPNLIIYILLGE